MLLLFMMLTSEVKAQEKDSTLGKPYYVEAGDSINKRTVEYFVLLEKKEFHFSRVNPSLIGHILIPEMRNEVDNAVLIKAAYAIAEKHRYPLVYFYSNKVAFNEIMRVRETNDWPDESLLRKGFLCKVEKRTFKRYYE